MPQGLELYNAGGGLQFSAAARGARMLAKVAVNTTSGSVTVTRSVNGGALFAAWTGFIPEMAWDGTLTIAGNTVSWSGIFPSRLPKYFIVGECSA